MKAVHILSAMLSLFLATATLAQEALAVTTSSQFGDDTVHYSVLNTRFLSPQVAKSYGITRGNNKFLVNVAVNRKASGKSLALRAKISGTNSDLIHRTPLDFREVIEQDAVYYLAEFSLSNDERRIFRLKVSLDDKPDYDIEFNKMLYLEK
ncbi:MAG: hypothetical protein ACI9BO_002392 [Zhongshania sp.]|jgi:hypothetical protein